MDVTKNNTLIFFLTLLSINTVCAEVFKCISDTNKVIYSDAPCKKGETLKSETVIINKQPSNETGYTKYTRGFINGHTGSFKITASKDTVAHITNRNNNIISAQLI